jgi:S1-C subfamily serine protease
MQNPGEYGLFGGNAIPPRPDLPYPQVPFHEPSEPRRPKKTRRVLAALLSVGLILGGLGLGKQLTRQQPSPSTVGTAPATSPAPALETRTAAGKVRPAIVDINTFARIDSGVGGSSGGNQMAPLGAATGIVLTSTGEVLTNNHVVDGAYRIEVTLTGVSGTCPGQPVTSQTSLGCTYQATVMGVAPTADVALIQIQGVSGLPTVTAGDASSLSVGQAVVAIGNALGRGGAPAVTSGSITALDRSITATDQGRSAEHLSGLIQTDAPIKPGDSGGALVDSQGAVVGMITAGSSSGSTRTANTGFAIPINTALDIVTQIRSGIGGPTIFLGQPGFLGVQVMNLNPTSALARRLNQTSGVLVVGVVPGSPAKSIGMTANSVIIAINGTKVGTTDEMGPALHAHQVGENIKVTWVDKAGTHTSSVRLVAGPAV